MASLRGRRILILQEYHIKILNQMGNTGNILPVYWINGLLSVFPILYWPRIPSIWSSNFWSAESTVSFCQKYTQKIPFWSLWSLVGIKSMITSQCWIDRFFYLIRKIGNWSSFERNPFKVLGRHQITRTGLEKARTRIMRTAANSNHTWSGLRWWTFQKFMRHENLGRQNCGFPVCHHPLFERLYKKTLTIKVKMFEGHCFVQ